MAVLFPLFIHSYLNLVNRGHKDQGMESPGDAKAVVVFLIRLHS